jgi:hypothetical protein
MTYAFVIGCIIIGFFALAGCGSTPYYEVGVGYQIDNNSDYIVRRAREWQCNNGLQAQFELGTEWYDVLRDGDRVSVGYHHESWINCGGPFNNENPELYKDDVRVVYRGTFRKTGE